MEVRKLSNSENEFSIWSLVLCHSVYATYNFLLVLHALVFLIISQRSKFKVISFAQTKYMTGAPKFKNGSRDSGDGQ